MTLKKVVALIYSNVARVRRKELNKKKFLYEKEFQWLHIFGTFQFMKEDNIDMKVFIDNLQQAPYSIVVYCLIDPNKIN